VATARLPALRDADDGPGVDTLPWTPWGREKPDVQRDGHLSEGRVECLAVQLAELRRLHRDAARLAVGMNYYTDDCPEETRPQDLNDYLYGQQHVDS
jgi:hypothetical protein